MERDADRAGGAVPCTRVPSALCGLAAGLIAAATSSSTSSSLSVSPGEHSIPTGADTLTSVPGCATMRRSTPSWGASTSLTAFSVSTVNRGSPAWTASPSRRSHSVTVPSAISRPHFGIFRSVGTGGQRIEATAAMIASGLGM